MTEFKELPLIFWQVSFDSDSDSYFYHKIEQIIDAVSNFIDINLSDCEEKQFATDYVVSTMLEIADDNNPQHAVMTIGDKILHVKRISLDKYTTIHKILCDAYDQVDDNLKKRISNLYQHSN